MSRPVVTVVSGRGAERPGPDGSIVELTSLASGHDLTGSEWTVRVRSPDDLAAVLDAAMRGASVTLLIDSGAEVDAGFMDELRRVADVREVDVPEATAPHLQGEPAALLQLLAEGLTVSEAARRINISPRSAYRQLAHARSVLGVPTTAEAVLAVRAAGGAGGDVRRDA